MNTRPTALIAVLLLCASVALAGCTTTDKPAASAPPKASHAPTPSATPTPNPDADALFTISANVRATDGSVIAITMTAHAPVAVSDTSAASALTTEYLNQCGAGAGGTPVTKESMLSYGATLLRVDLASNKDNQTFVAPVGLFFGSRNFGRSASGAGIERLNADSGCFGDWNTTWSRSGTAHGIAEFETDNATPDLTKWRTGLYGFSVIAGTNSTLENCTITLTERAKAAKLSEVGGWATTDTSGTTCATGYDGE